VNTENQSVQISTRTLITASCALLAVFLLLFATFGVYFTERLSRAQQNIQQRPAVACSVNTYILREYEGKIGIFSADETLPDEILDVFVFTLPDADRQALRCGIRVYSEEALQRLIEDFTG